MEDELDSEEELDPGLTAEQQVAADEAMLLDLGRAEEVADLIARQSLGDTNPVAHDDPDLPEE